MPPEKNAQDATQGPQDATNPPEKAGGSEIDLDAILLPKKEPPKSTARINAGALLEQEQSATLQKQPAQPQAPVGQAPAPAPASGAPQKPPAQAAKPKPPEAGVKPLQTYQGDIENLVQTKNMSVVSIAAAEAARRGQNNAAEAPEEKTDIKALLKKLSMMVGGIALLGAAAGLGLYVYSTLTATAPIEEELPTPFIPVDATEVIALPSAYLNRPTLMAELEDARKSNTLPLGLMGRFVAVEVEENLQGEEVRRALGATALLSALVPNVPEDVLRTLSPEHVLGVHTFDGSQAFLLLEVDSFERAFAGFLDWEFTMYEDLLPLFERNPRPRTPEELSKTSTTTAPQLLRTGFADRVVENRDTRAVLNTQGDILLLWTFLDRSTVVITTNEYTLREVISRYGAR